MTFKTSWRQRWLKCWPRQLMKLKSLKNCIRFLCKVCTLMALRKHHLLANMFDCCCHHQRRILYWFESDRQLQLLMKLLNLQKKNHDSISKPGTRTLKQLKWAANGSMYSASLRFLIEPTVSSGAFGSSVGGWVGARVGGLVCPGFKVQRFSMILL